jgi:glutamate synthase (NADPH/NADH) small chain
MGKVTGFIEIDRQDRKYKPAADRIRHYEEFVIPLSEEATRNQAARCMNCGIPFCHNGCPVNNQIPDWNDLVYEGDWKRALANLHSTNNFPEFTGRVCPAPCEASCTLNLNDQPVTIKSIECAIIDRGFREGWVVPEPPRRKTNKLIAVVGSGPAGLAAAQQLGRAGHSVHVFEKSAKAGGLLRYGIPDFKMEKHLVDRRVEQMEQEGVVFHYDVNVGVDMAVEELVSAYDAVLLAGGAEAPRDLAIAGRDLNGVHFAMEFLPQQNRRCLGDTIEPEAEILATGKRVVIVGGGDTGADCLGTCHRQKPLSVHQFEIMPKPPDERSPLTPWPLWPMQLRSEGAHEEGGVRDWGIATTKFTGSDSGHVRQLHAVRVGAPPRFEPIPGTEFTMEADLVLIAMGFVGPVRNGMIDRLGVQLDPRGNVATDQNNMSSLPGVFAAGDMRRGQSLVVWAIAEGRRTAASVDDYLKTKAMPLTTPAVSNSKGQPIAS